MSRAFVTTVAVLAAYNVARALGAFSGFEVAAAIGLSIVLFVIAVWAHLTRVELGTDRADLGRGAVYGGVACGIVVAVVALVAVLPFTADFLEDARGDLTGPELLYEIVVVVLISTVIPEEVAFRGVLLATGRRLWTDGRAVLVSSVLFGLWHIAPSLTSLDENRQLDDATDSGGGSAGVVLASVVVTFVAGLLFCWLRLRSRSLLAPVIAHFATNAVALVAVWLAVR